MCAAFLTYADGRTVDIEALRKEYPGQCCLPLPVSGQVINSTKAGRKQHYIVMHGCLPCFKRCITMAGTTTIATYDDMPAPGGSGDVHHASNMG